jgi:hypothetical protein
MDWVCQEDVGTGDVGKGGVGGAGAEEVTPSAVCLVVDGALTFVLFVVSILTSVELKMAAKVPVVEVMGGGVTMVVFPGLLATSGTTIPDDLFLTNLFHILLGTNKKKGESAPQTHAGGLLSKSPNCWPLALALWRPLLCPVPKSREAMDKHCLSSSSH